MLQNDGDSPAPVEADVMVENETKEVVANKHTDDIFQEFGQWLESCDGGLKKVDGALQHIRQVTTILSYVSPESMSVEKLLYQNNVRNKWLTPFRNEIFRNNQKRRPGTVRFYCNSLRLLMEFLECSKVDETLVMYGGCKLKLGHGAPRSLKKRSKKREYEKIYEDYDFLTNPEEVQRFDTSAPCRQAVQILEKFSVPKVGFVPTQNEYTLSRDFLLWHLSLDNGGRPG